MDVVIASGPQTHEQARTIAGFGDPAAGVVLARYRAKLPAREPYQLFRTINDASGALPDVLCGNTTAEHEERFAASWFLARKMRALVIVGVDLLAPVLIAQLMRFAAQTALDELWLVSDYGLTDAQLTAVGERRDVCPDDVIERFDTPAAAEPAMSGQRQPALPQGLLLPEVDFAVARAEAAARLSDQAFAAYDQIWCAAFAATIELVDAARETLGNDGLADHVQQLCDRCQTLPEMKVVCQATQAALLTRGWRLASFDLEGLLARLARRVTPAQRQPEQWTRLFAYRRPWRAAACALYGSNLTIAQCADVNLEDVADDGSAVVVDGVATPIPEPARVFVRAQLHCRQLAGAKPTSTLLVHDDGARRLRNDTILRQLQAAAEEVGFPVETGLVQRHTARPAVAPHLLRLERVADVCLPVSAQPAQQLPAAVAQAGHASVGVHLDGDFIRRRREELAIAPEDVAARLGIRAAGIRRLEQTGDATHLSAVQLMQVADMLALSLDQMRKPGPQAHDEQDPARLGSALLAAKTRVPVEVLADTLDWTLERTYAASVQLDRLVGPAGMRVHRSRACLSLVTVHDTLTVEELQTLMRRHRARRLHQRADARALLHCLDPSVPVGKRPERARSRLLHAGMVEGARPHRLSDDVRFSLALADGT